MHKTDAGRKGQAREDGLCCLKAHANAKAPWTCPCECHSKEFMAHVEKLIAERAAPTSDYEMLEWIRETIASDYPDEAVSAVMMKLAPYLHNRCDALPSAADMLQNLLAVIHRDGGHYVAAHGLEKASADAEKIVANFNAALPSVAPQIVDQVMAVHRASPGAQPPSDPLLIETLAQKMGNAGYCAYQLCREFLLKAFDKGRQFERTSAVAPGTTIDPMDIINHVADIMQSNDRNGVKLIRIGGFLAGAKTRISMLRAVAPPAEVPKK